MRSHRWLPASLALVIPALAWAGCGGDDTETAASGGTTTTSATTAAATTTTTTTTTSGGGEGGAGGEGGGTGGVGGVSTGGGTPGTDVCPVQSLNMNLGEEVTLHGSTTGKIDDYSGCGDYTPELDTPDVVYGFTFSEDGIASFLVQPSAGSTLSPTLSIETVCGVFDATSYCIEDFSTSEAIKAYFFAGTYYVVIDGNAASAGDFNLTVGLAQSVCGDGVLSLAEEQCDPGPAMPNDGCTDPGSANQCKFEVPPVIKDTCPGEAIAVPAGVTTLTAASGQTTIGYNNDYNGSCSLEVGGVDRVYQITPAVDGLLTVKIGFEEDGVTPACDATVNPPTCWDQVIYLRSTCDDAASELDCGDLSWETPESASASVQAGVPVWLVVDGYDGGNYSQGTYNLRFELN